MPHFLSSTPYHQLDHLTCKLHVLKSSPSFVFTTFFPPQSHCLIFLIFSYLLLSPPFLLLPLRSIIKKSKNLEPFVLRVPKWLWKVWNHNFIMSLFCIISQNLHCFRNHNNHTVQIDHHVLLPNGNTISSNIHFNIRNSEIEQIKDLFGWFVYNFKCTSFAESL